MNSPRRWLVQAYQISTTKGPRCPGLLRNIFGSSQSTKSFQTVGRNVASVDTATSAPSSHGIRAETRGAAGRPARTLRMPPGGDGPSSRPGLRTGAAPMGPEAPGNGLLPGAGRARAGLHRVPRLRGRPRAPVQLGRPAKVLLRVPAPIERQERAAQVLVGAGVVGIEPDRVLQLVQR